MSITKLNIKIILLLFLSLNLGIILSSLLELLEAENALVGMIFHSPQKC